MKAAIIEQMLGDPEIDPTGWLGEALIAYVKANPEQFVKHSRAMDYIVQALDPEDIHQSSVHDMIRLFSIEMLDKHYDQLFHTVPDRDSGIDSAIRTCIHRHIVNRPNDPEIKRILTSHKIRVNAWFNEPTRTAFSSLLKTFTPEEADYALTNWTIFNQNAEYPHELINILVFKASPGKLLELSTLDSRVTKSLTSDQMAQHLAVALIEHAPNNIINQVICNLSQVNLRPFYKNLDQIKLGKDENPKQYSQRQPYIDRNLCRCGVYAVTGGGLASHRKKKEDIRCRLPTLFSLIETRQKSMGRTFKCPTCDKICTSAPGLTLHRKNCSLYLTAKDSYGS